MNISGNQICNMLHISNLQAAQVNEFKDSEFGPWSAHIEVRF